MPCFADGRKQRQFCDKQQTSHPTSHIDSFMSTAATKAKEGRDAITANIKEVHLHTEQDNFTVIKCVYEQVDFLRLTCDSCLDCVVVEGNYETLYLVLNKALCVKSKAACCR